MSGQAPRDAPGPAARLYRLALRLYPAPFRAQFGDELATAFAESARERRARGGRRALPAFWIRAASDVIRHAAAERLAQYRGRPGGLPPSRRRPRDFGALGQDVRLALRQIRRSPVHAAIAILVLAVGLGANTAVFSIVKPLLLLPLPFRDSGRLVWVENARGPGLSQRTFRVAAFEALQERAASLEAMTAYFAFYGFQDLVLRGEGAPERLVGVPVAPGFFEVLGVEPRLGRGFTAEEWEPGGPRAVVLSDGFWRRRFAADPSVVGQSIAINDEPTLVAGVLPASFDFAATFAPGTRVDLLQPARLEELRERGNTLSVIARLAPGVTLDAARGELDALTPDISRSLGGYAFGTILSPLGTHVTGDVRQALLVLWAAVGVVLLIVCANLSHLQLVRSAARSREFAVRAALGAGRGRLLTQVLVEGLVLAGAGTLVGVPLAYGLTSSIAGSATLAVPLLNAVRVDGTVLAVTALTGVAAGLSFALLPAVRAAGQRPQGALSAQARGGVGEARQGRLRSGLVAAEIALASLLLVVAGLLLRSFVALMDVELGFDPAGATALHVELSGEPPRGAGRQRLLEAAARLAEQPDVVAAGLTDALPLGRNRTWGVGVPGRVYQPGTQPAAFLYVVGPGYLKAMGIALRAGRDVGRGDNADAPPVALVNQTLADVLYPAGDAVGRSLVAADTEFTIIGTVADVRQTALDEAPAAQLYLSYSQGDVVSTDVVVRSPGVPAASIRARLARLDAAILATDARPVAGLVDRTVSERRFLLRLLAAFSGVALLLAALGIYGVVSYSVARRVREIGVRLALGATRVAVLLQILRDTMALTLAGLAVGLALALASTRLVAAMLFGTSPNDVATFAGTAAVLAAVSLLAAAVPARRATRVDPMAALRAD